MNYNNWQEYVFSEFVSINPPVRLDSSQEYSFVEMKDLNESKKTVYPSTKRKPTGGAKFQNDDTLFARITPCLENGKICQVKGLENGVGFGSTEFLVFRGIKGISDTDFIYYLSRLPEVRKFAEQHMIGTSGRQRVNREAFDYLVLKLPDLQIQKRVAIFLTSIDDKIELNRQTNETLEAITEALFQEICVSKENELQVGWELLKLGNFIDLKNGCAFKGMDFIEDGIPVIKIKNVKAGKVILNNLSYVSRKVADKAQRFRIKQNDLLITMSGNRIDGTPETWVGKVGIFHRDGEYLLNQRVSILNIIDDEKMSKYFLSQLLSTEEYQYFFISNATSSGGQANISPDLIYNTEIVIPPIENLKKFNKLAKDNYNKIFANELEVETLRYLRDSLLPKLMKGEIVL